MQSNCVSVPDNPFNWSYVSRNRRIVFTRPLFVDIKQSKKQFIVMIGVLAILNSTFDSSLTSGAIQYITDDFGVSQDIQRVRTRIAGVLEIHVRWRRSCQARAKRELTVCFSVDNLGIVPLILRFELEF